METAFETIQRTSTISFPGLFGSFSINPPASFSLFGRSIYFYGVIIALGFLLGITYCAKRSARFGIREDDLYDLVLWLIPLSILGARLYFVLFKLDYYIANPGEILAIWNGGLAISGGVIAGVIVMVLVCRHKKIAWQAMLDLIVYGLLIGQILGRWGNFMNREAFGAQTDIFCRMQLTAPDGSFICVHPTFLYESLWNLALFIGLLLWMKRGKRKYDGQMALLYLFWYGLGRAWIEGLRTDSLYIGHTGIRVSQALSLALVLFSLAVLLLQRRREHPAEKLFVNRAAAAEAKQDSPAEIADAKKENAAETGEAKEDSPAEIAEPERENAADAEGPAEIDT